MRFLLLCLLAVTIAFAHSDGDKKKEKKKSKERTPAAVAQKNDEPTMSPKNVARDEEDDFTPPPGWSKETLTH